MAQTLTDKTRKGLFWSAFDSFGSLGIQFLFGIILARILSPEDYGIIAMPLIFLAVAHTFINSGFSAALVRKPDLKEEDLSTAFYFNIIVGVVCYIILFISSPWIAEFYNTPILTDLLKVTALATLFNPLCAVQQALLTRKINFKKQSVITISGAIISGIVGIVMAYSGYGVWSLVFQQVAGSLLSTILLWVTSDWRPRTKWNKESFNYLWGFGSKVLAAGLLDTLYKNMGPLLIGKFYTKIELGNYTRANQFADLPSRNVTTVLQRVTFPVLSTIQEDDERLVNNYRRIIRLSTFIVFPLMLLLSALADPLVRLLLTDKWEGCIVLLQIICFSRSFHPVHAINVNLLQVKGRSDFALKATIIKKITTFTTLLCTLPFGVIYMVYGGVFNAMVILLVNTHYTGKLINLGYFKQMRDIMPIFCIAICMWGIVHVFLMLSTNLWIQLIGGGIVGVISYIIIAKLFKRPELFDTINLLPKRIHKNSIVKFVFK